MIQVRIEELISQLDSQIQASLRDAVEEVIPDARFGDHELYLAFKRAVGRHCKRWERVSERLVDFD